MSGATLLSKFTVIACFLLYGANSYSDEIPVAPPENSRPANWQSSLAPVDHEALIKASVKMREDAAREYQELQRVNAQGKWKPTAESIDEHRAPEWFMDLKFGMFIDWGPWSIPGWAPKQEAGQMIPDWYEARMYQPGIYTDYHAKNWGSDFERDDFLSLFTGNNYDPKGLIDIAVECGMKYVVPFCKHHAGFCLWPSSFTGRDAVDMEPGRDLIDPLVQLCREKGLKFGFYFSVEEWEYPLLDANGQLIVRRWGGSTGPYTSDLDRKITGKIPVGDFATEYLVPQAKEFIDKYDPDLIWYDGEWTTPLELLGTYDIVAYLYNKAEGRKEVAVNDRYGKGTRSVRGDFYCSEYGHMGDKSKKSTHAWEECRGISQSYGYNWQDNESNVITSKQFIDIFVDIVAHGGNLLLMVNLDGQGALPKVQETRMKDIGKWLKINGEGIYATRPYYPPYKDEVQWLKQARWIWFPEGDPTKGAPIEPRYFRRTFMLPKDRKISKAVCTMGADNEFELFVNGQLAGQGRHYASAYDMDVKRFLKQGRNVLSVSAANAPSGVPAERNPAGLIGELKIEFEEGEPLMIVTDGSWLVSREAPDGWQEIGFDDTGWPAAMDLGAYGRSPWGILNLPTASSTCVFTQSKDNRFVYVILKEWPGQEYKTKHVKPLPGSQVTLLGYEKSLAWAQEDSQITIILPDDLQKKADRPCDHAWVLKIEKGAGRQ